MGASDNTLMRSARVMAKYPPNGSRPGWRKDPDGTSHWSGPIAPMPEPRPAPSREVGVRYDQRVRWGRFVGFEADDRGLLARVEFSDGIDARDPQDVVSIDRVVGLNGQPVTRAAGLDEPPTPIAVLTERIRELEEGAEHVAYGLEAVVLLKPELYVTHAARDLRALADRKVPT